MKNKGDRIGKKLLIIAGAGASIDFGMPSVNEIDSLFEDWARQIFPLTSDKSKSLYSWVKESLMAYSVKNNNNRIEKIVSFERLLFAIQNIATVLIDNHFLHFNYILNPFITIDSMPEIEIFGKRKIADGNDFSFLHSSLIDKLLSHFREKCKITANDKIVEIKKLRTFFKKLQGEFDLGFINFKL